MSVLQQIALTKIKSINNKMRHNLLAYFGSVEEIFKSSKEQLSTIPGIGSYVAENILSKFPLQEAQKELEFVQKHHIDVLWFENSNYPQRLKNCVDAPVLIYHRGNSNLNPSRTISIVGTRNATIYGRRIVEDLMKNLKDLDVQIISGLAHGIEVHAHRQALSQGIQTIAVMAHGLNRIYPSTHRDVASEMITNGGLLTEYPSSTNPEKENFPMRNRIIAGLSDVTIVVEAGMREAPLITAEIANSYNRDVCAFPGSIHHTYSAGCNYLIKTNRAHLIRNAADLCYLMNWNLKSKNAPYM